MCPLLKISHKLGLAVLSSHLMQSIESLLTPDNVCRVLASANETLNEALMEKNDENFIQDMWTVLNSCLYFVAKHKSAVLNSDSFLDMTKDAMIMLVSAKVSTFPKIVFTLC